MPAAARHGYRIRQGKGSILHHRRCDRTANGESLSLPRRLINHSPMFLAPLRSPPHCLNGHHCSTAGNDRNRLRSICLPTRYYGNHRCSSRAQAADQDRAHRASDAEGELDRRVQDSDPAPKTGRLGAASISCSALVSALKDSELSQQRLRRFVADAHTNYGPTDVNPGFAELYRRGGGTGTADVARVMQRIESRIDSYEPAGEDLLLLARLDQSAPSISVKSIWPLIAATPGTTTHWYGNQDAASHAPAGWAICGSSWTSIEYVR